MTRVFLQCSAEVYPLVNDGMEFVLTAPVVYVRIKFKLIGGIHFFQTFCQARISAITMSSCATAQVSVVFVEVWAPLFFFELPVMCQPRCMDRSQFPIFETQWERQKFGGRLAHHAKFCFPHIQDHQKMKKP